MGLNQEKLGNARSGGGRGWRPEDGVNPVRILPPSLDYFSGEIDDFAIEYAVHFLKPHEDERAVVVRCLRDKGKTCPSCDMSRKFKDSDDPGLKKMAKDIRRNLI